MHMLLQQSIILTPESTDSVSGWAVTSNVVWLTNFCFIILVLLLTCYC